MLLDTSAWIEFFNGTRKGIAVKEFLDKGECFTSSISFAELSYWVWAKKPEKIHNIGSVKKLSAILGIDEGTLELAGKIKAEKRKTVKDIGLIDCIIIATA